MAINRVNTLESAMAESGITSAGAFFITTDHILTQLADAKYDGDKKRAAEAAGRQWYRQQGGGNDQATPQHDIHPFYASLRTIDITTSRGYKKKEAPWEIQTPFCQDMVTDDWHVVREYIINNIPDGFIKETKPNLIACGMNPNLLDPPPGSNIYNIHNTVNRGMTGIMYRHDVYIKPHRELDSGYNKKDRPYSERFVSPFNNMEVRKAIWKNILESGRRLVCRKKDSKDKVTPYYKEYRKFETQWLREQAIKNGSGQSWQGVAQSYQPENDDDNIWNKIDWLAGTENDNPFKLPLPDMTWPEK